MAGLSSLFKLHEQGVGVSEAGVEKKITRPPAPYTEGTLTADMINASKFIADKALRSQLKEAEGIGTPATRAAIIDGLKDKGHVKVVGRNIVSTELGQQLHDISPEDLKDPGKTAVWETELKLISQGKMNPEEFVARQKSYVTDLVSRLKGQKISIGKNTESSGPIEERPCAAIGCLEGGTLLKIKGKFGPFWGCSKKSSGCCNTIKMDTGGNPYLYDPSDEPELPALLGAGDPCPVCKKGKKVVRVVKNPESKSFGKAFLACDSRSCKFVDWSQSDGGDSGAAGATSSSSNPRPEPLKGDGSPCRACGNGVLKTLMVTNPKSSAVGKRFLACSLKCGAKTIWEDQVDQQAIQPVKLVPDLSNPWRLPGEGRPCPKCNAPLVTQKVDPSNTKMGGKRFLACSNAVCGNTIWEERAMRMF